MALHSWSVAVFVNLRRCPPHLPSRFRGASFLVCDRFHQLVALPPSSLIPGCGRLSPTCGFAPIICQLVFVAPISWDVAVFASNCGVAPIICNFILRRFIRVLWPFSPTCGVAPIICHLVFVALHSWFVAAVLTNLWRCPHHLPCNFCGAKFLVCGNCHQLVALPPSSLNRGFMSSLLVCGRLSPTCGVASIICHLIFVALISWPMPVCFTKLWRCPLSSSSNFCGAPLQVCGPFHQLVALPPSSAI